MLLSKIDSLLPSSYEHDDVLSIHFYYLDKVIEKIKKEWRFGDC